MKPLFKHKVPGTVYLIRDNEHLNMQINYSEAELSKLSPE